MQMHARDLHRSEMKPHQCQQCLKSFSSNHQLVQHIRVHTGEKPYKCSYCDRRFKQLSHVQQHTRLHTGRYKKKQFNMQRERKKEEKFLLTKNLDSVRFCYEKRPPSQKKKKKIKWQSKASPHTTLAFPAHQSPNKHFFINRSRGRQKQKEKKNAAERKEKETVRLALKMAKRDQNMITKRWRALHRFRWRLWSAASLAIFIF